MNVKQTKFLAGLLEGKTKTQAYIDAGYSPKYAAQAGEALSRNPEIMAAVAQANAKTIAKAGLTKEIAFKRLALTVAREGEHNDSDATQAIARAAKMLGWDEPEKHEHVILTPEQRKAKLQLLLAKGIKP